MSNYKKLKEKVFEANMTLPKEGLVKLSWGNVSELSEDGTVFAIKPSGVSYETLKVDDIVIVDLETGEVVEGHLNPSTDTPTHRYIYLNSNEVKGICHTHSKWATIYAQIGKPIEVYGTTHADSFVEKIHCTRNLSLQEIEKDYEFNIGKVIDENYNKNNVSYLKNPAILIKNHGLFTFGKSAMDSVKNAIIAEIVAEMAFKTELISKERIPEDLQKKHNLRKHGENAYYGQKGDLQNEK